MRALKVTLYNLINPMFLNCYSKDLIIIIIYVYNIGLFSIIMVRVYFEHRAYKRKLYWYLYIGIIIVKQMCIRVWVVKRFSYFFLGVLGA